MRIRGQKPWGLLAYLLLDPVPPSRHTLAWLLFDEAADPLGALRCALTELRRALGRSVKIDGDPLRIELPVGAQVDCLDLIAGVRFGTDSDEPFGELLDGLTFGSSSSFGA